MRALERLQSAPLLAASALEVEIEPPQHVLAFAVGDELVALGRGAEVAHPLAVVRRHFNPGAGIQPHNARDADRPLEKGAEDHQVAVRRADREAVEGCIVKARHIRRSHRRRGCLAAPRKKLPQHIAPRVRAGGREQMLAQFVVEKPLNLVREQIAAREFGICANRVGALQGFEVIGGLERNELPLSLPLEIQPVRLPPLINPCGLRARRFLAAFFMP